MRDGEILDGPGKFGDAKEAFEMAMETARATIETVGDAIETGRQPGAPLDRLAAWTRAAPLHALAIAFLLGIAVARQG